MYDTNPLRLLAAATPSLTLTVLTGGAESQLRPANSTARTVPGLGRPGPGNGRAADCAIMTQCHVSVPAAVVLLLVGTTPITYLAPIQTFYPPRTARFARSARSPNPNGSNRRGGVSITSGNSTARTGKWLSAHRLW
ncbi:hypothetical protein HD554DRAFT_2327277 [Boletus coccyginus]|nr:hypothetical protein HD554DRAFT_2327277 [Boletus coccyginus]